MIEIQNLTFAYRKHKILDGISASFAPGSCTGIVGANGCGKSTLLSILAGARRAKGTMIMSGAEPYDLQNPKRPDIIGYIPQDNPLLENLSGYDNLLLWYKGSGKDFKNALQSPFIRQLNLQAFLSKKVQKMSGGMKKRVSIAAGLINSPSLLILDEPSAALDLPSKHEIRLYLEEYLKAGNTIIITSHDAEELSLCSHLLLLENGKLQASSLPAFLSRTVSESQKEGNHHE